MSVSLTTAKWILTLGNAFLCLSTSSSWIQVQCHSLAISQGTIVLNQINELMIYLIACCLALVIYFALLPLCLEAIVS